MEQTRTNRTAKILLMALLSVVMTLTMFFAILPAMTLPAHAEGETIEIYTNTKQSSYSSGCVTITVNDTGDGDGAKVDENRLMAISVSGNVAIKNAKVRIGYYYQEAGAVRSDVCDEVNVEGSGNHKTYVTFSNVNAKKITISTTFDMVQIDHVSLELIPVNGVTYELNGGSFNGEYIDYYFDDQGLTLPTNAVKSHYNFLGWYDNAELTGNAVTAIGADETGSKTFWAKWELTKHNITYNTNEGEWNGEYSTTYQETIGLTLPTNVTKPHFTFAGWYSNAEFDGEAVTEITDEDSGDKEYWAKWEHITHNITYHLNGGEWEDEISAPTIFNEGERFELVGPDCIMPVKTGYMFYGWYRSNTLDVESEIQIIQANETNDVELWAAWGLAPVAPMIEDVFPISGQSEYIGEVVTVEATANEKGFLLDNTHSITITFEEGLFPDHTIYLIVADGYEHNPQPKYITSEYEYNEQFITSSWGEVGHGGYSDDGINILSGPTIDAPWPFNFDAFDGSITVTLSEKYSEKSLVFKQIHVIAHHVRTVAYNESDGTMPEEYANKYLESRGLELPIPTRNAYAFIGWYDNEKLEGEAVAKITVADTGDKVFYAKWEFIEVVDLSKVTENVVIYDGQTITGELKENVQVTIADGATVTLKDVVIKGENNTAYAFAGITLEGDATLILEGENTVVGFQEKYPGIFVPENKTLTIGGKGTLDVSSNGFAPGIGAGFDIPGGNIVIEGGTINATGGSNSAGIGAGNGMGSCGDITITGGRVTATGGDGGAGIGGGEGSSCGNITITDTVKKVSASGMSANSIGAGRNGTSGTVTVGGQVYEDGISDGDFVYSTATAEEFAELIEHLGKVEYTDAYKEKLDEARELYKDLSDEQKARVDAQTLKVLTDAEDEYQDLEDKAIADEATEAIEKLLPSFEDITVEDKDDVKAAREAYEALTDEQKAKVDPQTLAKLKAAEKEINDIETSTETTETINNLPATDEITPESKQAIEAARTAYDALSPEAKEKVSKETLAKLEAAEDKLDSLVAAPVSEAINALKNEQEITLDDQAAILAARAAYDALTDKQKAKVDPDTLKKLTDAEAALKTVNERAAAPVVEKMEALPETITSENKEQVLAARAAYDALTREQKALVPQETRDKLLAAEKALAEISLIGYRWYVGYSYDIKGAYFQSEYGSSFLSNDVLASISNYSNTWYFNFESAPSDQGGYSMSYWTFNVTDGSTPSGLEVVSGSGTKEDPYVFNYVTESAPEYVSVDATSIAKNYQADFAVDRVVPIHAVFTPAFATDKAVRWSLEGDALELYEDKDCTTPVTKDTTSSTVYAKGVKTGSVTITAESLDIVGVKYTMETEVVIDENIGMTWFLNYEHEITANRFGYEGGSGQNDLDGYELISIRPYAYMDGYYVFEFEKDGWTTRFTINMSGETRTPTGLRITRGAGVYSDPYYLEPIFDEPPYTAVGGISLSETEYETYTGELCEITATFDPKYSTDKRVIWSVGAGAELYTNEKMTTLVGPDATDLLTVYLKAAKPGLTTVTVTSVENSAATATANVNVLDGSKKVFVDYVLYSEYSAWHGDKLIVREVGSAEPFATLQLTDTSKSSGRLYLDSGKTYEFVWYGGEDAAYCGFQFINASTADSILYVENCGNFTEGQIVDSVYVTNKVIVRIDLSHESITVKEGEVGKVTPEVNPGKVEDTTMTWSINKNGIIELYADRACTTPLTDVIESRDEVFVKGLEAGIATITFTSVQDPLKHSYCVVTVAAAQPTFNVSYQTTGSWNGASLYIRAHGSSDNLAGITVWYDNTNGQFTLPVGFYDLVWEKGHRQGYYEFTLNYGEVTLTNNDFTLENGILKTFALGSDEQLVAFVTTLIEKLNVKGVLAIDDKAELEAVRAAYEALTAEQKQLVDREIVDKLVAAEEEMADIVAAYGVEESVLELPEVGDITPEDKEAVEAARAAYEALTEKQKEKVRQEVLDKLTAAEKEIAEISAVHQEIVALPEAKEVTTANKEAIESARAAYEALTAEQKEKVGPDMLAKLEAAENGYKAVEVEALIESIGDVEYNSESHDAIAAARAAYDALTPEQKTLVDNYAVLTAAEATYGQKGTEVGSDVPGGIVAGIVIASIAVIVAGCFLAIMLLQYNKNKKNIKARSSALGLCLLAASAATSASVALYILIGVFVLIAVADVFLFVKNRKLKEAARQESGKNAEREQTKQEAKGRGNAAGAGAGKRAAVFAEDAKQEDRIELSDEAAATEDEAEDGGVVVDARGNYFNIRYNRSFTAKLIQSAEETKGYYGELKNEVLSYEKTKSHVSWSFDSVNAGRAPVVKFGIRGKTLCMYFPLDADSVDEQYKVEKIESSKYASVPCMYRIKNERRMRYAKELIATVCSSIGLTKGETKGEDYYLPYESTGDLVAKNLIKELTVSATAAQIGKAKQEGHIRIVERVSVSEADSLVSNEVAAAAIVENRNHATGKKGIVNVDTLSANYDSGDTVTVQSLIEKKLVAPGTGQVKLLARGTLDKVLHVELQDYSIEAVKMILATGGTVKRC